MLLNEKSSRLLPSKIPKANKENEKQTLEMEDQNHKPQCNY